MEKIDNLIKEINENLDFLFSDYGFQKPVIKNIAYEYSCILKNKNVELIFLTELRSISVPDIIFKISRTQYDLNNLSEKNKLKEITENNYNRTNPITENLVNQYVRKKIYNDTELINDFETIGKSDINDLILEIAKIFKDNPTILKGNRFPFFKAKWKKFKSQLPTMGIIHCFL